MSINIAVLEKNVVAYMDPVTISVTSHTQRLRLPTTPSPPLIPPCFPDVGCRWNKNLLI